MNKSLKHQQGVVIVVALLIVALVAAMAITMLSRVSRDTRRTTMLVRDAQASYYANGSLIWAMEQLRRDWMQQTPNKIIDAIPIRSPVNNEKGYQISSIIYDMQSRLNINNLSKTETQTAFNKLIQMVAPAVTKEKAAAITNATAHWIGAGAIGNQSADFYLHLPEPYRPAYKSMLSVSELLLVKDMTPAIYRALSPFLTALPAGTALNVQTAPLEVLASLSPSMTQDAARAIIELRKQKPFASTQQFFNLDVVKNHPDIKQNLVTTTSQYFLVETSVVIENQRLVLYTLLQRFPNDRNASVAIRWQSKGTW